MTENSKLPEELSRLLALAGWCLLPPWQLHGLHLYCISLIFIICILPLWSPFHEFAPKVPRSRCLCLQVSPFCQVCSLPCSLVRWQLLLPFKTWTLMFVKLQLLQEAGVGKQQLEAASTAQAASQVRRNLWGGQSWILSLLIICIWLIILETW